MDDKIIIPNDSPLVSVLIPSYNRPLGLKKTLMNVTQQTYSNLEIIVSNDASPDKRVDKIAKEFADRDKRIRYFRQQNNIGDPANHRFVYHLKNGSYFCVIHDDDTIPLDYIKQCMDRRCDGENIVLIGAKGERLHENKHLYYYDTWSNIGDGCFTRLRQLIPYFFKKPAGFEQYWYGIMKSSATESLDMFNRSGFYYIAELCLQLADIGCFHYADQICLKKYTTNKETEKYIRADYHPRRTWLKPLGRKVEVFTDILYFSLKVVINSKNLSSREKMFLSCLSLYCYIYRLAVVWVRRAFYQLSKS